MDQSTSPSRKVERQPMLRRSMGKKSTNRLLWTAGLPLGTRCPVASEHLLVQRGKAGWSGVPSGQSAIRDSDHSIRS